jgi:hypothetical protein
LSLQEVERFLNQMSIFGRIPLGQQLDGKVFTPYATIIKELVDDEPLRARSRLPSLNTIGNCSIICGIIYNNT